MCAHTKTEHHPLRETLRKILSLQKLCFPTSLLFSAIDPFNNEAGLIDLGIVHRSSGVSSVFQERGAVRILGQTNVVIDGCNSGVPNIIVPGGSTISELMTECAEGATNHGQFVSCISHVTANLKKAGTITGQQKSAIQRCAAQADMP